MHSQPTVSGRAGRWSGSCRVVVLAAALLAVSLATGAVAPAMAQQQRTDFISMKDRFEQWLGLVGSAGSCAAQVQALAEAPGAVYGGLRVLPSGGRPKETLEADRMTAGLERSAAKTLQEIAASERCPEAAAMAVGLKFFFEMMNETAVALAPHTLECVVGKPCPGLIPVLDEETGHEVFDQVARPLVEGFSIKLRSPFVPWNTSLGWEEDVVVTDPIAKGSCVAVFKETRGLMLRLRLARIDVVRDPWATPMLARGTKIPVWALEWAPSQYGKTWNICNHGEGLRTTVSQRIKQDMPLNYFWRFFGRASHK